MNLGEETSVCCAIFAIRNNQFGKKSSIRFENTHNLYHNNSTARYVSRENVCACLLIDTYRKGQSSSVCNDPKLETLKFLLTIEWVIYDIIAQ